MADSTNNGSLIAEIKNNVTSLQKPHDEWNVALWECSWHVTLPTLSLSNTQKLPKLYIRD